MPGQVILQESKYCARDIAYRFIGCQDIDLVPLHLVNTHPDNDNVISLNTCTKVLGPVYPVGFLLVIEIQ